MSDHAFVERVATAEVERVLRALDERCAAEAAHLTESAAYASTFRERDSIYGERAGLQMARLYIADALRGAL